MQLGTTEQDGDDTLARTAEYKSNKQNSEMEKRKHKYIYSDEMREKIGNDRQTTSDEMREKREERKTNNRHDEEFNHEQPTTKGDIAPSSQEKPRRLF